MQTHLFEWILMLLRWLHIIAAIAWIGTSFFFMWLDRSLEKKQKPSRDGHIGNLWMVHSGGFYEVEKLLLGPNEVPSVLHWFKWEAAVTWISGFLMLVMIFYTGSGTFLLDGSVSELTYGGGILVGIVTIFGTWLVYDFLWQSPLAKRALGCHALTLILAGGMAFGLCQLISGRAAFMLTGAMLGTWMVGNVWVRILPGQEKMIAATRAGEPVNPQWGINAKNRSVHNNYFTLPIVFIMMSNHFPTTYGHDLNWLFLLVIGVVGASIRHFFNVRHQNKNAMWYWAPAALGLAFLFFMTLQPGLSDGDDDPSNAPSTETAASETVPEPDYFEVDPATAGVITGVVTLEGDPGKPKRLRIPATCGHQGSEPVTSDSIRVVDGKVQNALVYISSGLEGKQFRPPEEAVEVDQVGCVYSPHVVGVRAGQPVTFINSDALLHNVRTKAKNNKNFNIAMPRKGQRLDRIFKKPEVAVHVQCSLHPWMGAYLGVFDHPYFAITGEDGSFTIPNLPPGEYEITVWHERFGEKISPISVGNNGPEILTIGFKLTR